MDLSIMQLIPFLPAPCKARQINDLPVSEFSKVNFKYNGICNDKNFKEYI